MYYCTKKRYDMQKLTSVPPEGFKPSYNRKTIIGIDTATLISAFTNIDSDGNSIVYELCHICVKELTNENIAELIIDLPKLVENKCIRSNPTVILNIDVGIELKHINLDALFTVLDIITTTLNAKLLWSVSESQNGEVYLEMLLPIIKNQQKNS